MTLAHTVMGIVDTARISVPTVIAAMQGPLDADESEGRLAWWSAKLLSDARITLAIVGCANVPEAGEPLVVMSNHQSLYDIPVLYQCGLGRLRMVTKAELFQVPVWGRAMKAAGFIRIDRADRDQAVGALRGEGRALLASGTRVWIAPEGTRSLTGALGPFKSGGFRMAMEHGARILPIAIDGTRHVLPAKGVVVNTGQRVKVTILPAIDPRSYGAEGRKQLAEDVRQGIARALGSAGARA